MRDEHVLQLEQLEVQKSQVTAAHDKRMNEQENQNRELLRARDEEETRLVLLHKNTIKTLETDHRQLMGKV